MKKTIIALLATVGFSQANANLGTVDLVIETTGLESMKGQHYEGWDIIDGMPYSTGRFAIQKSGSIYQVNAAGKKTMRVGKDGVAQFAVEKNHVNSSLFILTIEPNGDTDAGPSPVHVMGGAYTKGEAQLSIGHGSSLGSDFSAATGGFILAAPTGGNFNQGVWFLDPSVGEPALTLPQLPGGWAYEGWIVNTKNGKKFSTGLFKSTMGSDSDNAGPLAGPLKLSFPGFPGQDIVQSPVVLDDGKHAIVVSVEPYPDYDSAPYAIKVFKAPVASGAPGMTLLPLENISAGAPTGQVHIH